MELIEFKKPMQANTHELLNNTVLVDRIYCLLTELGMELNYGEFVSKYYKNGIIKVLKSLHLYKTIGRADNKKILIDPRILFVVETTVLSSEIMAKSLINFIQQRTTFERIDKTPPQEYLSLEKSKLNRTIEQASTYIVFNPDNNLYKIGRSKNIIKRIESLKITISNNIKFIAFKETDIEAEIHFDYHEKRMFGEWFSLSMDDVLDIANKHKFTFLQN